MAETGKTALITGASVGIGRELAKLFAQGGYSLVLVARNATRLSDVATELEKQFGTKAKPFPLDLTSTAAPQFLFDQLQRENIAIDILVNNAGYGKLGAFATIPYEETAGQIALNITALTHLTKLFLAPMLERNAGRILNVASTAGFQPGPLMAVYYATKAYVISFSEALANELRGTGVTVTCLCPGLTNTEFQTGWNRNNDAVQANSPDGRRHRCARRLSCPDERQAASDLRNSEPLADGITPDQPASGGDGSIPEILGVASSRGDRQCYRRAVRHSPTGCSDGDCVISRLRSRISASPSAVPLQATATSTNP